MEFSMINKKHYLNYFSQRLTSSTAARVVI